MQISAEKITEICFRIRNMDQTGNLSGHEKSIVIYTGLKWPAEEEACKKAGIRSVGGIHTLRYSFETHLLENGVDLRYIQELSGLSRSTTTEIYTHVSSNKIGKIRSPLAYLREKKRQGME